MWIKDAILQALNAVPHGIGDYFDYFVDKWLRVSNQSERVGAILRLVAFSLDVLTLEMVDEGLQFVFRNTSSPGPITWSLLKLISLLVRVESDSRIQAVHLSVTHYLRSNRRLLPPAPT